LYLPANKLSRCFKIFPINYSILNLSLNKFYYICHPQRGKFAVNSRQFAVYFANCQLKTANSKKGGLAQLARALAWHARGHRFDSDILHFDNQAFTKLVNAFFLTDKTVIKQKAV
jgi:hypothetical protein